MTDEELESIPWSRLMDAATPQRSKLIYAVAGALALFAIGAVVARGLSTRTVQPVAPVPQPTAAVETAPATTAAPIQPVTEADLLAAFDGESTRAAAAFAEWFVRDFFTVDGDAATRAMLEEALPPGVPMDLLPHGATETVTYVEWASPVRVTEATPGRYEVLVLFGAVTAPPGGEFQRVPTRAVTVPMEIGGSGGLRLTDLPAPARVPARPEVAAWHRPEGPGNPRVAGAALGFSWPGAEFEGVGAERIGDEWRTLVRNELAGGTSWPFVITIPDEFLED